MKKFLLFLAGLVFINPAFAGNFYIQNYDIDMNVNKDKSVDVVEYIDVFFYGASHGIFRTIPQNKGRIVDVVSPQLYTKKSNGNSVVLKLGDPAYFVRGEEKYKISFKHLLFDSRNEFYYNIVGTDWPVEIEHVNFKITLPEKFDAKKVGFSIGEYGSVGFDGNAEFYIKDNTIIGQTRQKLNPYEGITLRVELPKGYFVKTFDKVRFVTYGIILLLTLLSFLLWYNVGRDRYIVPKVTFYAPKGVNSAEAELYYKGEASSKGITSLIVYLASKGYINIIDNKDCFTLKKVKTYDGVNPIEKDFMKSVFGSKDVVTETDLRKSTGFYESCKELISKINNLRNRIFEKNSISFTNMALSFFFLLGVITASICLVVNFNFSYLVQNVVPLTFLAIAILVAVLGKFKLPVVVWAILFGGGPIFIFMPDIFSIIRINVPEIILCLFAIIVCIICIKELPKRNEFGERAKGELLGLKKFIEVSEKRRLELLVEENPSYFYDILPFAYILDVSDKWIDKFESIISKSPEWYQGEYFSVHRFNNFTKAFASTTVPSVANGGISTSSSGGGGFSGGGSGGGGGGSW